MQVCVCLHVLSGARTRVCGLLCLVPQWNPCRRKVDQSCALHTARSGPRGVTIHWQAEPHVHNVGIKVDCTCIYWTSGAEAWWQTADGICCELSSSDRLFINHFCRVSLSWWLGLSLWLWRFVVWCLFLVLFSFSWMILMPSIVLMFITIVTVYASSKHTWVSRDMVKTEFCYCWLHFLLLLMLQDTKFNKK